MVIDVLFFSKFEMGLRLAKNLQSQENMVNSKMFHSVIFRQILCLFSFSTFISREEPQKHHPQEVARAPFQQVLILSLLSADIKGLTQVFGVSQCQLCAQCLKDTRMFSCSEIALFWHKNETKR